MKKICLMAYLALTINAGAQTAQKYYEQGEGFQYSHLFEKGIESFTKSIELDPKYFQSYQGRGYCKIKLDNYKAALEDFSKVIELVPNFSQAYFFRGMCKIKLQDYKGAVVDEDAAILHKKPENLPPDGSLARCYFMRGVAKFMLEQTKEALEDFNQAMNQSPSDEIVLWRGKCKLKLGDKKGACEDFDLARQSKNKEALELQLKNCQ